MTGDQKEFGFCYFILTYFVLICIPYLTRVWRGRIQIKRGYTIEMKLLRSNWNSRGLVRSVSNLKSENWKYSFKGITFKIQSDCRKSETSLLNKPIWSKNNSVKNVQESKEGKKKKVVKQIRWTVLLWLRSRDQVQLHKFSCMKKRVSRVCHILHGIETVSFTTRSVSVGGVNS